MPFLKAVWTFLVGVKDFLVLLLIFLVFAALWASLSSRPSAIRVPDGTALLIALDGVLVDQAARPTPFDVLSTQSPIPETQARDVIRAIDRAADDKRIRLILLDLDSFLGGGLANLEAVGEALLRARKAGKEVRAFATAYIDQGYYLAAHADEVWMDPLGAVVLTGPGGPGLYFAEALDKLGIDVEVFRVGTFKSAVEPFTRSDQSPEARAADQALADSLWTSFRSRVEGQRTGLDLAAFLETYGQRAAGANISLAQIAQNAGLVDTLGGRLAFAEAARETVGAGDKEERPGDFRYIAMGDYLRATDARQSGPGVGVVHISGTILDGEGFGASAGAETIATLIEDAAANADVKALVLRIDSPGGSVTASERIREAALAARAKGKPVVASFGPLAASGGYWVATAAETIIAHPTTITGSIGVFGVVPTFAGTLDKLGIGADGVATTPFTGQPDVLRGLNDPARALLQASVADVYRRFVRIVAEARKLPEPEVEAIAEGRVWSGTQALDRGLVDRFGSLEDAVAEAGRLAKLPDKPRTILVEPPVSPFERLLSQLLGSAEPQVPARASDAFARLALAGKASVLAQMQAATAMTAGPAVQAVCLSCLAHVQPRAAGTGGRAALLLERLFG
jgi:protease-4